MRRILSASIWSPTAIPAEEWKYRNLKRVMFPTIDFLFILGGLSAARFGIPAISEFFPDPVVDAFSYVLSAVGLACLIGVSFPRLWGLEMVSKILLLTQVVGYVTALFLLTAAGEGNRGFVLIIAAVAVCPVLWRLTLLASEWSERRAQRKVTE